jgi:hypothetical protein
MLQQRETVGFVGAVLAHAAALPLLSIVPLRLPSVDLGSERAVSFEIEESNPLAPLPPPAPEREPSRNAPVAGVFKAREATKTASTTSGDTVPGPEVDNRLDPGAVAWLGGAPPPMRANTRSAGDGWAQGGVHPATPAGVDPGRAESTRLERSVHDALAERDHALGLDAAGALVGMAEDCVRSGDTPIDGRAYFDVTINPDGTVAGVQVVAGTAPAGAWLSLASSLREAGRSRSVLWRHTGKPLRVRLEVSSRWVLPSGSPASRPFSPPHVKSNETWDTPGADGLVPLAPAAATAGTHFDVSDIGARTLRDVHARIVKEHSP